MSLLNSTQYYILRGKASGLSGVFYESKFGSQLVVATYSLGMRFTDLATAKEMCERLNSQTDKHGFTFTVEKVTFTKVKEHVARHLGLSLTKTEWSDYRLNFRNGHERTAYYTDDLDDVLGTARVMSKKPAEMAVTDGPIVIR